MLINSSAGLHQAARTGMGIVMVPDALVEQDLRDGKLVALMPSYQLPSRPMHGLCPGSTSPAETASFRRLRREDVGKHSPPLILAFTSTGFS
jgi:DNA-binding transcriptional LysR family regulator